MSNDDFDLSGNIEITETGVRFSEKVGKHVTNEQMAVLLRTAERLRKVAVCDRYPADPVAASIFHLYADCYGPNCRRNEHDVPIDYITDSMINQMKRLGKL